MNPLNWVTSAVSTTLGRFAITATTDHSEHDHHEAHRFHRSNWLRAAVLGANDGIISTASLLVGVIGAGTPATYVLITGMAAIVAGAVSMAAGEYVSVSAQADAENSDLNAEARELNRNRDHETAELASIYEGRGLDSQLATQVAEQLMEHDALGAHARDEIGIDLENRAAPLQAAWVSALAFSTGAVLPVIIAWLLVDGWWVALSSVVLLAISGGIGAQLGGASIPRAVGRIVFWGSAAMAVTYGIGHLIGNAFGSDFVV